MYYLAFSMGVLGSLHCLGMCAPLWLSLPIANKQRYWGYHGIYQLGRLLSYLLLGLTMGILGQGLLLFASQQQLSLLIGLGMLAFLLLPLLQKWAFPLSKQWAAWHRKLKELFAKQLRASGWHSRLALGLLNGLLPCGLVYMALAGATATGHWFAGIGYMGLFGLGTLLLPLVLLFLRKNTYIQAFFYKMQKVLIVLVAILFVMRGLNLGIPFLSPQMSVEQNTAPNCHVP